MAPVVLSEDKYARMESRFCGASEIVKGNSRMFETRDRGITDAFNSAIEGSLQFGILGESVFRKH